MTTMMPDTCTFNTRITVNTKKNSLKVMNAIKVVKMLVDKMLVKYLLNPKC